MKAEGLRVKKEEQRFCAPKVETKAESPRAKQDEKRARTSNPPPSLPVVSVDQASSSGEAPPLAACFDTDATLPNKAAENRRKLQFVERAPPPIDQDLTSEPNFRCPQCKEPYCKWQTYFSKKLARHLVWARCSAYSKIHNSFKCPFYVYHPGNLNLIRSTTAASSAVQID